MAGYYETLKKGGSNQGQNNPAGFDEARMQGKAAKQQRQLARISLGKGGYGGPRGKYRRRVDTLYPYFQSVLEPGRMRAYEQAALGEQRMLRGIDADYADAGLLDSGAYMQARQGARGYRAASENQALIDFYEEALRGAMGEARPYSGPTTGRSGGGGSPFGQLANTAFGAGGSALSTYLLLQGLS